MLFTSDQWVEIADFPICPVKALEEALVGKEILKEDVDNVDRLIVNLKRHEQELRVLRQEIERKVRAIKMESIQNNLQ